MTEQRLDIPREPRGAGPKITIPMIIDDVKTSGEFPMARCTYFSIECDAPSPDWTLGLSGKRVPFLLLGVSGIIYAPYKGKKRFDAPEVIEGLFTAVEEGPSLYIDTNDVWLPHVLFSKASRGEVYRIGFNLFTLAFRFREDRISLKDFLRDSSEMKHEVRHSPIETRAYRAWVLFHIEKAKQLYPKNRELVLRYRT